MRLLELYESRKPVLVFTHKWKSKWPDEHNEVYQNLRQRDIDRLIQKSKDDGVRILSDGVNYWIWDAYGSDHYTIAKMLEDHLGIEFGFNDSSKYHPDKYLTFTLSKSSKGYIIHSDNHWKNPLSQYEKSPQVFKSQIPIPIDGHKLQSDEEQHQDLSEDIIPNDEEYKSINDQYMNSLAHKFTTLRTPRKFLFTDERGFNYYDMKSGFTTIIVTTPDDIVAGGVEYAEHFEMINDNYLKVVEFTGVGLREEYRGYGLSRKIFDYLYKKYEIVISGESLTQDGLKNWMKWLQKAPGYTYNYNISTEQTNKFNKTAAIRNDCIQFIKSMIPLTK